MTAPLKVSPRYAKHVLMTQPTRDWIPDYVAKVVSLVLDKPLDLVRSMLNALPKDQLNRISESALRQVMSDNMRFATEVCSRYGWFIDAEFPAASAVQLAAIYEAGEAERADESLAEYYRNRVNEIREALVSNFPQRAGILAKAFRMHLEGEYDVSVPLFLIQADGICLKAFGREFFRVRKGTLAAYKALAGRDMDWIWQAMLEPFRCAPPLAVGSRRRRSFNRNQILHGCSLDYGTEANSLRAVSLLAFLHGLDCYANANRRRGKLQSEPRSRTGR